MLKVIYPGSDPEYGRVVYRGLITHVRTIESLDLGRLRTCGNGLLTDVRLRSSTQTSWSLHILAFPSIQYTTPSFCPFFFPILPRAKRPTYSMYVLMKMS